MKIYSLASGSSGNCFYIKSKETSILVDCGISATKIKARLKDLGQDLSKIGGVLVTHEHGDHSRAATRLNVPIWIEGSCELMTPYRSVKELKKYHAGMSFVIGDLVIQPFHVLHNAVAPCGFAISEGTTKIGFAIDVGNLTAEMLEMFQDLAVLMIEADYDPDLLARSGRTLSAQRKSRRWHLSNFQTVALLDSINKEKLKAVMLTHLSEEANTPERARETVSSVIDTEKVKLVVAPRDEVSEVIEV